MRTVRAEAYAHVSSVLRNELASALIPQQETTACFGEQKV
jgi:hypothetical protein